MLSASLIQAATHQIDHKYVGGGLPEAASSYLALGCGMNNFATEQKTETDHRVHEENAVMALVLRPGPPTIRCPKDIISGKLEAAGEACAAEEMDRILVGEGIRMLWIRVGLENNRIRTWKMGRHRR